MSVRKTFGYLVELRDVRVSHMTEGVRGGRVVVGRCLIGKSIAEVVRIY